MVVIIVRFTITIVIPTTTMLFPTTPVAIVIVKGREGCT